MAKPKTILYVNPAVIHGGAEEVLLLMMLNARESGYKPVLVVPGTGWLTEQCGANQIDYEILPTLLNVIMDDGKRQLPGSWLVNGFKIAKLARKWQAVLVHSNSVRVSYHGGLGGRLAGIATVTHNHEISAATPYTSSFKAKLLNLLADRTLVPSQAVKQFLLGYAPKLQPKLQVLYNGWDTAIYDAVQPLDLQALYGLPTDAIVIGTASAIEPLKGQVVLLEAFKWVQKRNPQAYLMIVGSARGNRASVEYEAALRQEVQAANLADKVIFTGWREDVWSFIKSFDILAHTPTLPDALPTVLIHACGMGRACVASDIGGIGEIVQHKVNGLLVTPANPLELAQALHQLINDEQLRIEYGRQGRQHFLQRFSKEQMRAGLDYAYQQCLKRK